jgi:hypothetical protein
MPAAAAEGDAEKQPEAEKQPADAAVDASDKPESDSENGAEVKSEPVAVATEGEESEAMKVQIF